MDSIFTAIVAQRLQQRQQASVHQASQPVASTSQLSQLPPYILQQMLSSSGQALPHQLQSLLIQQALSGQHHNGGQDPTAISVVQPARAPVAQQPSPPEPKPPIPVSAPQSQPQELQLRNILELLHGHAPTATANLAPLAAQAAPRLENLTALAHIAQAPQVAARNPAYLAGLAQLERAPQTVSRSSGNLAALAQIVGQASQSTTSALLPQNAAQQALAAWLLQGSTVNGLANANAATNAGVNASLLAHLTMPQAATSRVAEPASPPVTPSLATTIQPLNRTAAAPTAVADPISVPFEPEHPRQQQRRKQLQAQLKRPPSALVQDAQRNAVNSASASVPAVDSTSRPNNGSHATYPMDDISDPGPHDVLLGRGSGASNHLGNIRYRTLISQFKPRYTAASRLDKPKVADEIVHLWRNLSPPGRFLTRCDVDSEDDDDYTAGTWRDAGDSKAKTKTCQCLREKDRARKPKRNGSD